MCEDGHYEAARVREELNENLEFLNGYLLEFILNPGHKDPAKRFVVEAQIETEPLGRQIAYGEDFYGALSNLVFQMKENQNKP